MDQTGKINFTLGKTGQTFNTGDIKEGVRVDKNATDKTSVFLQRLDSDGNGVLSKNELSSLMSRVDDFAADGEFSEKEAKSTLKFLSEKLHVNLKDFSAKDVFNALNFLKKESDNIESSRTENDGSMSVTYKRDSDGVQETYNYGSDGKIKSKDVSEQRNIELEVDGNGYKFREDGSTNAISENLSTVRYDAQGNEIAREGKGLKITTTHGNVVHDDTNVKNARNVDSPLSVLWETSSGSSSSSKGINIQFRGKGDQYGSKIYADSFYTVENIAKSLGITDPKDIAMLRKANPTAAKSNDVRTGGLFIPSSLASKLSSEARDYLAP